MKCSPVLPLALCALLFSGAAAAQLRLPRSAQPAVPAPAPAAPSDGTAAALSAVEAEKVAAGKLAAHGWLLLLDRRDWGRAWEGSSIMLRASTPLPNWMDNMPKTREAWGSFIERTPGEAIYRTSLEGKPDGEYVSAVFASKFEKRELEEIVTTVRETDGRWRVTGYAIR